MHSLFNLEEGLRKRVTNLEHMRGGSILTKVVKASLNGVVPKATKGKQLVTTPPDTPRSGHGHTLVEPTDPPLPAVPSQAPGSSGLLEDATLDPAVLCAL